MDPTTRGSCAPPPARVRSALLIELAALGRADVTRDGDPGRPGRLVVRDPAPTGDPLLDAALALVGERAGQKPKNVLGTLAKGLRGALYERLTGRGILRSARRRVLGLFPVERRPAADGAHETRLREALRAVLVVAAAVVPAVVASGG